MQISPDPPPPLTLTPAAWPRFPAPPPPPLYPATREINDSDGHTRQNDLGERRNFTTPERYTGQNAGARIAKSVGQLV